MKNCGDGEKIIGCQRLEGRERGVGRTQQTKQTMKEGYALTND